MHRVLEVINTSQLAGGAEHLSQLVRVLIPDGWRVTVACTEDGPFANRWREVGAEVVHIDMMRRRINGMAVRQLRNLLRQRRFDLVHCHGTRAAFFTCLAQLGIRKTPTLYTVHGFSFRKTMSPVGRMFYRLIERFLCKRADHVIFVSYTDARDVQARRLLGSARLSVIPNGVDLERFSAQRPMERSQGPVVATVSRLVEQKGVESFVEAAGIVSRRLPGCEFWIVGDGPLRSKLATRARAVGLDGNCFFLGASEEVEKVLATADLFVLPSLWEGLPIALLEAMAAGLPVIATDTTGSREVIERSGVGILVPRRRAGALADAILRLLQDRSLRERMGVRAREAVAKHYNRTMMDKRNRCLYGWLVEGTGAR